MRSGRSPRRNRALLSVLIGICLALPAVSVASGPLLDWPAEGAHRLNVQALRIPVRDGEDPKRLCTTEELGPEDRAERVSVPDPESSVGFEAVYRFRFGVIPDDSALFLSGARDSVVVYLNGEQLAHRGSPDDGIPDGDSLLVPIVGQFTREAGMPRSENLLSLHVAGHGRPAALDSHVLIGRDPDIRRGVRRTRAASVLSIGFVLLGSMALLLAFLRRREPDLLALSARLGSLGFFAFVNQEVWYLVFESEVWRFRIWGLAGALTSAAAIYFGSVFTLSRVPRPLRALSLFAVVAGLSFLVLPLDFLRRYGDELLSFIVPIPVGLVYFGLVAVAVVRRLPGGILLAASAVIAGVFSLHAALVFRLTLPGPDLAHLGFVVAAVLESVAVELKHRSARAAAEERAAQGFRLSSLGLLAGGIAHDFNNILASIRLAAESAAGAKSLEDVRRRMTDMQAATDRGQALVGRLLGVTGQDPPRPDELYMQELIENLRPALAEAMPEGVSLGFEVEPDLPMISGDRVQLEQVVVNLVLNARDAVYAGGRVIVFLGAAREPGAASQQELVLEVADSGPGVSHEARKHIFEPFYSTKLPGEGMGIGLALCHSIVLAHGGRIEVAGRPGEGARFRVFLPVPETPPVFSATDSWSVDTARVDQGVCVVVEDDDLLRRLLADGMREQGWTVLEADGPMQALRRLEKLKRDPSIAILDYSMPGMSGLELLEELRRRFGSIPGVIVSGFVDAETRETVARLDGVRFLGKPFLMTELETVVRELR